MTIGNDLRGKRFGRLVVINYHHTHNGNRYWLCKCDCGGEKIVKGSSLNYGSTQSCGCLQLEVQRNNRAKAVRHGFSHKERLYQTWKNMRRRCSDPSNKRAEQYFNKGITVCEEWNDYTVFRAWAMENGYRDDLTIDRINNGKGYCPENCRWATAKQQANNQTRNRMITYNGITMTMSEWADSIGVSYSTLNHRMQRGWPIEKALCTPQRRNVLGHYVT